MLSCFFIFQASHFLADWCSANASHFQGKSILELGSGLGLTGLAIIQNCKPSSYTFTDVHDSVLKTLLENVNINLFNESPLSYNANNGKSEKDLVSEFLGFSCLVKDGQKPPGGGGITTKDAEI